MRREIRDDYIGPSKGWAKFLHRLVMFITYPVRKPLIFFPLLIALYLTPTFRGVKPAEVHLWYWNHIKNATSTATTVIGDKTQKLLPNIELPKIEVNMPQEKVIGKVVDMPVKDTGRKMFEKAKSGPQAIDILEKRRAAIQENTAAVGSRTQNAPVAQVEKPKKKLPLVYVNEPKAINGTAKVINANEIVINGETLFLYGIYVDPNTRKGQEAKVFLDKTINGEVVDCNIEAYTYQGIATGICRVKEINLNKELVEQGYSKNVALD